MLKVSLAFLNIASGSVVKGRDGNMRRRLPRQQRERLIVEGAVQFFAEVGLDGQTRALAERLGVTQPLLYRYFPHKDALIERVYHEVSTGGWDPAWDALLRDRTRPLAERLVEFYGHYVPTNFRYERVRLMMFAGLKDATLAAKDTAFVHERLFTPVAAELQAECGLDEGGPGQAVAVDLAAGLHGAIGYLGVRCCVGGALPPDDMTGTVTALVRTFVQGAPAALRGR